MVKEKVIAKYTIGGAMSLTFYIEPTLTYHLDVFVFLFAKKESNLLISLQPIYDYCRLKKYPLKQEHVLIEGVAVQFVPAYNALIEMAVDQAVKKKYGATILCVLSLEYLMAIMLQTGRPKDHARLVQVLSDAHVEKRRLGVILKKHGLSNAWQSFLNKYQ